MTEPDPCNFSLPFPDQLIDKIGLYFTMGTVGGSAFHFIKGIYNSPAGVRLSGGATAVRMNMPRIGGRCAALGGLSVAFNSGLEYIRQKKDPWNSIFSTTATFGFLEIPNGFRASARWAAVGGLLEGGLIVLDKTLTARLNKDFYNVEK